MDGHDELAGAEAGAAAKANLRGEPRPERNTSYDRDLSVPDLFAQALRFNPDAVAIIQDDRAVTYAELDRMSDAVAAFAAERGAGRGDFVGIWSARSIEAAAAMLGVMKSGAAFVPFDPAYPASQLAFMIEDCAPKAMLAQRALLEHSEGGFRPPAHLSTALEDVIAGAPKPFARPAAPPTGGDRAYAMYTSGSTGKPKGVIVPHRGITRLVREQTFATYNPDDRYLHACPLAFDVSTFELWGPLLNGGSLVVVPEHQPSLSNIAERILGHGVNSAWLTSGLFHLMVDHRIDALKPLRQLLAGGDVLSPVHVDKALKALPDCQLINGYGPTENTTFTTCYRIPKTGWGGGSVPVGHALTHTTVYILDPDMNPVPDGEMGLLWTGGDGVAEGYLGRPELTEKVFVTAPTGERLYNTGDLARVREDGAIEFHGRNDRQVKISGRRIELDEIEIAIRRDEETEDAAVICDLGPSGEKTIYGFAKPSRPVAPDAREAYLEGLVARLSKRLPKFMIPSRLTAVDALPLNTSGKLDRKRLMALANEAAPAAPATPAQGAGDANELERLLAGIWRETLGAPAVGLDQNFFDVGGSSLLMTAVHARLEAETKKSVPLVLLFAHPTIRGLVAALEGGDDAKSEVDASVERARRQRELMMRARKRP